MKIPAFAKAAFVVAALAMEAKAATAVRDGSTTTTMTVDACGSKNCATVRGPIVKEQAGFVGIAGINDTGKVNRVYATEAQALKTAFIEPLWDDTFNATAQNTAKYRAPVTTQTVIYTGGFVTLNGTAVTSINTNSAYQTYRTFPLFAKSELRLNISGMITVAPQANAVTEMGLFTATLPGGAVPSDGCFFRWNAAAELRGVCSYNATETQTAAIASPSINVNHDFVIVIQTNTVGFWIDDALAGAITLFTDAPTLGQPMIQGTVPFTMRYYIGGSAPALASQLKVSNVFVSLLGPRTGRTWGEIKAGFGHMAYQGQNGGTMGTTANYVNSANPTAAVPTNTTAALGTGLGGQFWETASLAVNTDGVVSSYQNPVGTVTQTPRMLYCSGVKITSYIQTVIVGGPFIAQWSLAFGHTAVSLATAEAATTKTSRRIAIGTQLVTAAQAVSTLVSGDVQMRFDGGPIAVAPGEFIATVTKHIGTVGTSGVIAHMVSFDCKNE